jgi:hypothetical protein
MDDIKQKYKAEVTISYGRKIQLSHHDSYTLKFKIGGHWAEALDCGFSKDNQKTLSSTKPSYVTITSHLTTEDINHIIKLNDKFTIHDHEIGKIGKGKIIEVVKQE